jgi:predicted DsbA family dithiol-disulfide isomerase
MPISGEERPRLHATAPACRAVVAARLHAPESEAALLRRLRVRTMAGALLDDDATLRGAAEEVGVDADALEGWMEGEDVTEALRADMAAARDPSEPALVLDWRLAETEEGMRYTCPSYQFVSSEGECFDIPGFRPVEAYEVVIANLAPELDRRHDPEAVEEVLEWAGEPLATVEVARVAQIDPEAAREQLARVASLTPVANDGYWSL